MKLLSGSLIVGVLVLASPLGVSARSECESAASATPTAHAQSSNNPCDETPGHTPEHSGVTCGCVTVFVPFVVPIITLELLAERSAILEFSQNFTDLPSCIFHPPA
jgi:hypothetical protein